MLISMKTISLFFKFMFCLYLLSWLSAFFCRPSSCFWLLSVWLLSVSLFSPGQIREEKRREEGGKSSSATTEIWHSEWSWSWEDERWEREVGRVLEILFFFFALICWHTDSDTMYIVFPVIFHWDKLSCHLLFWSLIVKLSMKQHLSFLSSLYCLFTSLLSVHNSWAL